MNNMNIDENTMQNIKNMVDNGNISEAISNISPEMIQNFSQMLSNQQNNNQNNNNSNNNNQYSNSQNSNNSNNSPNNNSQNINNPNNNSWRKHHKSKQQLWLQQHRHEHNNENVISHRKNEQ